MCLLVFAWQVDAEFPLMVGANRDEMLGRPALAVDTLHEDGPRILGGRDLLAGGTWLAVNEHGLVAGLTNRPSPGGRDLAKRSRGLLPLMAAGHRRAEDGVDELVRQVRPGAFNPAWLLVGDRDSLFYVELGVDEAPDVRRLAPGIHVLENVPLGGSSPKVDRVRHLLDAATETGRSLWTALPALLGDHTVPDAVDLSQRDGDAFTICMHLDGYGTRSAALVRVSAAPEEGPGMWVADGPPCRSPFDDAGGRWTV